MALCMCMYFLYQFKMSMYFSCILFNNMHGGWDHAGFRNVVDSVIPTFLDVIWVFISVDHCAFRLAICC